MMYNRKWAWHDMESFVIKIMKGPEDLNLVEYFISVKCSINIVTWCEAVWIMENKWYILENA